MQQNQSWLERELLRMRIRKIPTCVIGLSDGFVSGQHVGFVVDKAAMGQVFSEYFGFPCQSFHQFLHHHNHLGLTQ
jgi:hypothetical protein